LHGFGRWITVYWHGKFSEWIGFWNHGTLNGYGSIYYCEGTIEEGFYEKSDLIKNVNDIKSYHIGSKCAKQLKIDSYRISLKEITGCDYIQDEVTPLD
jgi:hypothetical protein